jgi:hypothetical protein
MYLRMQAEIDHAQGAGYFRHAIEMVNAATRLVSGGTGSARWTRVNGSDIGNAVDLTYPLDDPSRYPVWVSGRLADHPGLNLTYDREMSLLMPAPAPAGRVPDGGGVPGAPLTVDLTPGGDVTLSWDVSCAAGDDDYEIYQGTLGDFASHAARFCGTGGLTTRTFTPAGGGTYYLVVPRNGSREGSYGLRSDGSERPRGVSPCLPQLAVTVCQ